VEAARLFYDDLNESLITKMGFVRNSYNPSVYNERTSDGYVAIRTHVDDLKISLKSEEQLSMVLDDLKEWKNTYQNV